MWPLRWQAGRDEVAKRSRRGREEVGRDHFGFARIPFRLFLGPSGFAFGSLQEPSRVAFGNYGVRFGSEKDPFSDLFRKWFQPCCLEVNHRLEVSRRTNFLTFLKAIPFQTGSHRAPRGFRPEGASKPLILDETCRHLAILPIILAERY